VLVFKVPLRVVQQRLPLLVLFDDMSKLGGGNRIMKPLISSLARIGLNPNVLHSRHPMRVRGGYPEVVLIQRKSAVLRSEFDYDLDIACPSRTGFTAERCWKLIPALPSACRLTTWRFRRLFRLGQSDT
jgi:hypothetical protein